jgi:hypothetical protein
MFKRAWDKSFTEENIQSAFRKSGIWPTDGSNIIKKITRPMLASPQKTDGLRSPKSAKAIRRFQIAYEKEPTVDKVKKVFSTALHLSARVAVLEHENKGLYNAIDLQKKKGRIGVRLNLGGQPNKEIIDCYSPGFVVKCREYQEEKEAIEAAEEQAKLDRKIKRAANALRKKLEAAEKAKRAEERTAKAAEKQLAKDLAAANKPAQKTQKEIVSKEHKVANKARPRGKLPVRSAVVVPVEGEVTSGVVVAKTATRSIKRPSRYVQ